MAALSLARSVSRASTSRCTSSSTKRSASCTDWRGSSTKPAWMSRKRLRIESRSIAASSELRLSTWLGRRGLGLLGRLIADVEDRVPPALRGGALRPKVVRVRGGCILLVSLGGLSLGGLSLGGLSLGGLSLGGPGLLLPGWRGGLPTLRGHPLEGPGGTGVALPRLVRRMRRPRPVGLWLLGLLVGALGTLLGTLVDVDLPPRGVVVMAVGHRSLAREREVAVREVFTVAITVAFVHRASSVVRRSGGGAGAAGGGPSVVRSWSLSLTSSRSSKSDR